MCIACRSLHVLAADVKHASGASVLTKHFIGLIIGQRVVNSRSVFPTFKRGSGVRARGADVGQVMQERRGGGGFFWGGGGG